ncbi:extracellular solute-binding protein [Paenibacillus sp. LMG 31460]|uniref:Extracellular solute-binding protein n=1 Tax=Paenibacillus germinis TaxID=2654979 RepID=A0ABX1Z7W7_9BACL|nr:extracellular solute-binding protein [Paenibacillus germinis]NOU88326.1 extracellular solute-binding protein [Paenibacillus germinis]
MKVKKVVTSIFLTLLASSVLLSGCSTKSGDNPVATPAQSANSSNNSFPIVKDKINLKFAFAKIPQQKKSTDQLKVVKDMEALTNIHIEWDAADQGYQEKKNLMFASNDLPDAFFGPGSLLEADLLKYGSQGMLIPLEKLIDQYAPNIKCLLEKNSSVKKLITAPDGHIYSIPTVVTEGGIELGEVLFVNKTWLDKLGLSVPKTTAEFEQMLMAFKDKDLNGNGKKDEIPFSFINNNALNGIFGLYGSFGLPDNASHLMLQDGKVSYIATRPEYKEATQYLHSLYKQGLIDPEAFTQERNIYFSKGRGKEGAVFGAFAGYNAENVVGPDHAKNYVAIAPLKGPKGHQVVNMNESLSVQKPGFAITSKNKHQMESIRWIDALYDERRSIEWQLGPVGVNFKETNGDKYEYLPTPSGISYDDFRCTEAPCFGSTGALLEDTYKKIELNDKIKQRLASMEIYKPFMKKFTLPPGMFMTIEDTNRLNVINIDITDFVKKKQSQWIINGNIDSEWDSYLAQLKKVNLDEFVQIYQKTNDRFQSVK